MFHIYWKEGETGDKKAEIKDEPAPERMFEAHTCMESIK